MSHPLDAMLPPMPTPILFCTEGNPAALLLTFKAGRRSTRAMQFGQAESALAWCRGHGAVLVYCPAFPDRN